MSGDMTKIHLCINPISILGTNNSIITLKSLTQSLALQLRELLKSITVQIMEIKNVIYSIHFTCGLKQYIELQNGRFILDLTTTERESNLKHFNSTDQKFRDTE